MISKYYYIEVWEPPLQNTASEFAINTCQAQQGLMLAQNNCSQEWPFSYPYFAFSPHAIICSPFSLLQPYLVQAALIFCMGYFSNLLIVLSPSPIDPKLSILHIAARGILPMGRTYRVPPMLKILQGPLFALSIKSNIKAWLMNTLAVPLSHISLCFLSCPGTRWLYSFFRAFIFA